MKRTSMFLITIFVLVTISTGHAAHAEPTVLTWMPGHDRFNEQLDFVNSRVSFELIGSNLTLVPLGWRDTEPLLSARPGTVLG